MEPIRDSGDSAPMSEINVTPFIDVMLVLLIIFMVTAPLMLGGVHVNLPKSAGSEIIKPEDPLIVSIDSLYRIYVDKEEINATDRHSRFQQLSKDSPSGEVYVKGDGDIKYSKIIELMTELGQAGFAKVTLVTDIKSPAPQYDKAR